MFSDDIGCTIKKTCKEMNDETDPILLLESSTLQLWFLCRLGAEQYCSKCTGISGSADSIWRPRYQHDNLDFHGKHIDNTGIVLYLPQTADQLVYTLDHLARIDLASQHLRDFSGIIFVEQDGNARNLYGLPGCNAQLPVARVTSIRLSNNIVSTCQTIRILFKQLPTPFKRNKPSCAVFIGVWLRRHHHQSFFFLILEKRTTLLWQNT